MLKLRYIPLEKLPKVQTVDRIEWIKERVRDKHVLDLGALDETAMQKKDSGFWLHGEVSKVAVKVTGIDSSPKLSEEGLVTGVNSVILRGDIYNLDKLNLPEFEVLVGGELIEHLPNTLEFLMRIKNDKRFRGKTIILTTPNASSLTNFLLALVGRESSHQDHLQIYSYKTLNTLCLKVGFKKYEIIPCHVKYTEILLDSSGLKRILVLLAERTINLFESLFPYVSGGMVLYIEN